MAHENDDQEKRLEAHRADGLNTDEYKSRKENREFTRSSEYDYDSAQKAGLGPDDTGHWPSRVPDTGLILKGKNHPTYNKTVEGEKEAGMKMYRKQGRMYSKPK